MHGGIPADRGALPARARAGLAWALRLALFALAAGAALHALWPRGSAAQEAASFVCPMHPAVHSSAPERCPVCNMTLVPAAAAGEAARGEAAPIARDDLVAVRALRFPLPTRAPAWIDADGSVVALFYLDEIAGLGAGTPAAFQPALSPIATAPPAAVPLALEKGSLRAWDEALRELRFRFVGDKGGRSGETGWVSISGPPRPVLALDEDLVFVGDGGRYVLVPARDGRSLERRRIQVGRVVNGRAVIVSGLREGEEVVRRRAFFLDADRRERAELAAGGPAR